MDEITRLVVATSMRDMFQKGWIDICCIKECLKLMGITPIGKSYDLLHALHCVKFTDMPVELAEKVPGLIESVFNGLDVNQMVIAVAPAPQRNGSHVLALVRK